MVRNWLTVFEVLQAAQARTLSKMETGKRPELQEHIDLLKASHLHLPPAIDVDGRLTWRGHELLEDLGPREALETSLEIFRARQVGATEERLRGFLKEKAWQRLEGVWGIDPSPRADASCEGSAPAGPTNEAAPAADVAESGGSPSRAEPTGEPTKSAAPAVLTSGQLRDAAAGASETAVNKAGGGRFA